MSEFVRVSIDADTGVAVVQLDRPKLNALNRAMQDELRDTFVALGSDDHVRAVVMHGNERAFAAGADIKEVPAVANANLHGLPCAVGGLPTSCSNTV